MIKNVNLIDGKGITLNVRLANMIGVNAAIVLQQIHYWIEVNKKAGKNFKKGKYWCYNSIKKWQQENFPFWCIDTVKQIFKKLEKLGLLISAQFNKAKYDHTKWYTIDYDKLYSFFMGKDTKSISEKTANRYDDFSTNQDWGNFTQPIPESNSNYNQSHYHSHKTEDEKNIENKNDPDQENLKEEKKGKEKKEENEKSTTKTDSSDSNISDFNRAGFNVNAFIKARKISPDFSEKIEKELKKELKNLKKPPIEDTNKVAVKNFTNTENVTKVQPSSDNNLSDTSIKVKEKKEVGKVSNYPAIRVYDDLYPLSKIPQEDYNACVEKVKDNICYTFLTTDMTAEDKGLVDSFVLIMTDVLIRDDNGVIKVSRQEKPADFVKSIFKKISSKTIKYAINQFKTKSKEIKYRTAYIRTLLFNSVLEIDTNVTCADNGVKYDKPTEKKDSLHTDRNKNTTSNFYQRPNRFVNYKQPDVDFDKLKQWIRKINMKEWEESKRKDSENA